VRVLIVNSTFFPERVGGAEIHTLNIARGLKARGHKVEVVCGGVRRDAQAGSAGESYSANGVRVVRLSLPADRGKGSWGSHSAVRQWALEWFQNRCPDLVHFGLFWGLLGIAEAAREMGVPYTIIAHLYSLFCYNGFQLRADNRVCDGRAELSKCTRCQVERWSWRHRACGRIGRIMGLGTWDAWQRAFPVTHLPDSVAEVFSAGKDFMKGAARILAPTRFVAQELIKNGARADQTVVCPHGVSEAFFSECDAPAERSSRIRLGVVSRLSPEKGVATLIRAFRALPSNKQITLDIYGTGEADFVGHLRRLAAGDDRIRFCGFLEHERLPEALRSFDAIVVPSEWKEVSGIAAREALAMGVPVIASDVGGLPEAVEHEVNGMLFPPGNVAALRDAILRLCEDSLFRRRLSEAECHIPSIEENVIETERIFQEVLAG